MNVRLSFSAQSLIAASLLMGCSDKQNDQPASGESAAASVESAGISVSGAYIIVPIGDAPAAMYLQIANSGTDPDSLVAVAVEGVNRAEFHITETREMDHGSQGGASGSEHSHGMHGSLSAMRQETAVEVPASGSLQMHPGGRHIMLMEMSAPLAEGEKRLLTLTFSRAGVLEIEATVITYADIDLIRSDEHGNHH